MNCSLSGDQVVSPVVSPKSGRIFERSVIEAYLREHGTDPVSGDSLAVEDLITVSTQPLLPKTPVTASIPGLLLSLQGEYDALVLEGYELRQELEKTRAELSSALIRNDASLRVIARLTGERDESRTTLYELNAPPAKRRAIEYAGDEFDVNLINDTARKLAKARKVTNKSRQKPVYEVLNPVPGDRIFTGKYVGPLDYEFQVLISTESRYCQLPFNDLDHEVQVLEGPALGNFETILEFDNRFFVVTATSILENNRPVADHIVNVRYHPAGFVLGIEENTLAVYDKSFNRLEYDSKLTLDGFEIHPDGDLILCTTDSGFDLFSFKRQEVVASCETVALHTSFSENGYLIALTNAAGLYLFDLRHDSEPKCVDSEMKAVKIAFDGSGKLLALLDEDGSLHMYEFKNKVLTRLEIAALDVADFAWHGQRLITVSQSGEELGRTIVFKSK